MSVRKRHRMSVPADCGNVSRATTVQARATNETIWAERVRLRVSAQGRSRTHRADPGTSARGARRGHREVRSGLLVPSNAGRRDQAGPDPVRVQPANRLGSSTLCGVVCRRDEQLVATAASFRETPSKPVSTTIRWRTLRWQGDPLQPGGLFLSLSSEKCPFSKARYPRHESTAG